MCEVVMNAYSYYVISTGSKEKLFTLRHVFGHKNQHIMVLGADLETAKIKAREYAGKDAIIEVLVTDDSVSKISRRSNVDWSNQPVNFGKYVGHTPKEIAQNDYRYFLWVAVNGSKKWADVFVNMMNEPEYAILKEKYDAMQPASVKAQFTTKYPDVVSYLEKHKVESGQQPKNWFGKVYLNYVNGQYISENAINIIRDKIKEESLGVISQHVGKIGERKEFLLKIKSIKGYWSKGFGYNSGSVYNNIYTMKDRDGNVYVYMGQTKLGEVGEIIKVVGNIKKHDNYNGVSQTHISRPKLAESNINESSVV